MGEKNPAGGGSTLLKGGLAGTQRRGAGELGDAWGGVRERGGRRVQRETARAAGIGPRPAGAGGGVAALQWLAAGRARLTGGTGRPRGPVGSDGVRGEHDLAMRR
jgi:hypothetical protein